MNRRLLFVGAVMIAVLLPFALSAQEKKDAAGTVSITGCFNKGADADHYILKDEKTGKDVIVMGDAAMLARHANNHKVTITGTQTKEKDKDVVKATKLDMLSVCP
jgi:hypothetical protein